MGRARTILITGATSGLGLALARLYDARGERLVLTGRRPRATLDDPVFARHPYVEADLRDPSAAAGALRAALAAAGIDRLDVLVQNAAVGSFGPVEREPRARADEQVTVNLWAPVVLTRALLPAVLAAGGRIAFVSSVAADAPCAEFAVYAATKAALDGFARSLRGELRGRASVLVLHPGATRTGIHAKSGAPPDLLAARAPHWAAVEPVARAMARAIDGRAREKTIGFGNRALRWACRHLPSLIDRVSRAAPAPAPAPATPPSAPRRALVTGAADGIGRALAERLLRAGWEVVGVDRDRERAATLAGARFLIADLGVEADLARLETALAAEGPFDLVVHNAGLSSAGAFEASDLVAQREVLDVNLGAPLRLTPALLRTGRVRAGGALVCVSSLSHYVGYPGAAVYAATKDGLASYGRSLAAALFGRGFRVLTVFPGPTRTAHARRHAPPGADESRRMPPEQVADAILRALARRRRRVIPGLGNRIAARLALLSPALMDRIMRRVMQGLLEKPAT